MDLDAEAINQSFETKALSLATASTIDQRQAAFFILRRPVKRIHAGGGQAWAPNYD
jgi:hypothetical protein